MGRALLVLATLLAGLIVPAPAHAGTGTGFPKNFLWGVSISGFQHEGSFPDSNWTRYSKASKFVPYKNTVDFRHRYRGDLKLAQSLGSKVFRTSIEWARVEPSRGKWDWNEIRYYDDLVNRMERQGMRPMLTLSHFVHPGWVQDAGAWLNPRTVSDWLRFSRFIVNRYKGRNVLWVTFNEASYYMLNEVRNGGIKITDVPLMRDHLVKAHKAAYDMIHKVDPGTLVTTNTAYSSVLTPLFDRALFTEVTDEIDYIGLDYYLGSSLLNWSALYIVTTGEYWKARPEPDGIYHLLKGYKKRFPKLPVFIVENGTMLRNGVTPYPNYEPSDFIRDHLYWIHRAMQEGVKVIGYNYWSLLDAYEWGMYEAQFGLYTVDVKNDPTLTRKPTEAAAAYREIIKRNGLPSGYVPKKKPAWCSLQDPFTTCFGTLPTPPIP